ncbi:MAG TPA: tripartite tricarboxylate transporter substrate binding protein [Xanthobacteraceae bacterium]|nr:tripartite tricarboxylate transporter substrate binding protein [Xanthobacteraceae bacterium]
MSKISRRRLLQAGASIAVLPSAVRIARAETYPSRPVRIICGFAAGGAPDILARLFGQWLSERLGQPFVVEDRTGAGGNIATEAVVQAPADGYTLLLTSVGNAVNASLYDKLSYNFLRDITPVAGISREPLAMEVNPAFPAKTVPAFIAYAKANPGKVNFGSAGVGSSLHMAGELFKLMAGVDLVHVPYRGSPPALADLLAGQLQLMFSPLPSSIGYLKSGKLDALAVTTAARSPVLPDVPTIGDFVPSYDASAWYGIGAPTGTPPEIVQKLNSEINAGLADLKLKAHMTDIGSVPFPTSVAEFGKHLTSETEKWAKVVRTANIKPE